jgi:hypothetical protein
MRMAERVVSETPQYRVAMIDIDDGEGTLEERVERTRRLCEVNGWDILEEYPRGISNYGPHLMVRKPKSAPDVTPFVDPNAPRG